MSWDESLENSESVSFTDSFIARFDGKGFSRLTSAYTRPYDLQIHDGMVAAVERIIKVLSPDFVYNVSDEISAFFFNHQGGQLPFGGKESKIVSIGASASAVAFSAKLGIQADFDGRAFSCPDHMAKEYLLSRTKSGFKNSVSQLAQCHFSSKKLHGVRSAEKIDMLDAIGIKYHDMPESFKYGTIWYKESVPTWSSVASREIIRNRWRSTSLSKVFDEFAISRLEATVSRLNSQGSAGPKPDPPDPESRSAEAGGQGC